MDGKKRKRAFLNLNPQETLFFSGGVKGEGSVSEPVMRNTAEPIERVCLFIGKAVR